MKPKQFGKIVKSLRVELLDYQSGGMWTQRKLADATNLSERTIGAIERGERTNITDDEIALLADALLLSTMERQEFFNATRSLDGMASRIEPGKPLEYLWQLLEKAIFPTYLVDPFFNLIGMNNTIMAFHGWTDASIEAELQRENGGNLISRMFQTEGVLRSSAGPKWVSIISAFLSIFRFTSLRYRHTDTFDTLLTHLHTRPDFSQIWQETRQHQSDLFSMVIHFDYVHRHHGSVAYAATIAPTVTNMGELYFISHAPLDRVTTELYLRLGKEKQGARIIKPWPCF